MLREEKAAPNAQIIAAEETNDPGHSWLNEVNCDVSLSSFEPLHYTSHKYFIHPCMNSYVLLISSPGNTSYTALKLLLCLPK